MGNWYDDFTDYVPAEDRKLNSEIEREDNPNVIMLKAGMKITLLSISEEDFDDKFSYGPTEFRFIKTDEFIIDNKVIKLFTCRDNEDLYILEKEDEIYLTDVYQPNEYYTDDNKLTLTGWDYNVIINLEDMTSGIKYVR